MVLTTSPLLCNKPAHHLSGSTRLKTNHFIKLEFTKIRNSSHETREEGIIQKTVDGYVQSISKNPQLRTWHLAGARYKCLGAKLIVLSWNEGPKGLIFTENVKPSFRSKTGKI